MDTNRTGTVTREYRVELFLRLTGHTPEGLEHLSFRVLEAVQRNPIALGTVVACTFDVEEIEIDVNVLALTAAGLYRRVATVLDEALAVLPPDAWLSHSRTEPV